MYNDNINNANIIDTSNRNKKRIFCVICFPKVQLNLVNAEEFRYKCPRCKNDYQILGHDLDLVPEEDELISSHDESEEGPVLVCSDSSPFKPAQVLAENKVKSDIKVPWYMKDTDTTTVTHYRED
jgi:hypothetical protein